MISGTNTSCLRSGVTLNTKSCRIKFARTFIRSLVQIKKQKRPSLSSSEEEIHNRTKRIKTAAYWSMARVVGPRMKWSRALLFNLRNRLKHPKLVKKKNKRFIRRNNMASRSEGNSVHTDRGDKLRKLVPGGKSMDFCSLLEETAHYIACLSTQVKVMQVIADNISK